MVRAARLKPSPGNSAVDKALAEVLLADKAGHVKCLQAKGWKVAMAAHGIKVAPAFAQAAVGLRRGKVWSPGEAGMHYSYGMKKRVLILSASAGTGHLRCGEALEKAFATDPRTAEVIHEDALKYTKKLFRAFYSTLYAKLVRTAPQLLGFAYRSTDEPWKNEAVRLQFDRLNTRPLVKFIRNFDPQITVCTHFLPVGIISHLIEKEELREPVDRGD